MEKDEVINYIKEVEFGYLATLSENLDPSVRPISIKTVFGDILYFFTFQFTDKVREMEKHPKVEVVWSKVEEQSQVRINGVVERVVDAGIISRFKDENPFVTTMLPPEIQHLFCLYKLTPEKVRIAEGLVPYENVVWSG